MCNPLWLAKTRSGEYSAITAIDPAYKDSLRRKHYPELLLQHFAVEPQCWS